jgi:hypothetical protein
MPAHRKHFECTSTFLTKQQMVRFFLQNDFLLFFDTQYKSSEIQGLSKRISTNTEIYRCYHELSSLQEAFSFAIGLFTELKQYLSKNYPSDKISAEWNYLGQNDEREFYLSKVEEMFWMMQDKDSLQNHSNLAEMTESPWKLARYIPDLDFSIPSAADYFTSDTISFVDKMMNTLTDWELNPYFLANNTSNFHWNFTLNNISIISGTITKTEKGMLVHEMSFDA